MAKLYKESLIRRIDLIEEQAVRAGSNILSEVPPIDKSLVSQINPLIATLTRKKIIYDSDGEVINERFPLLGIDFRIDTQTEVAINQLITIADQVMLSIIKLAQKYSDWNSFESKVRALADQEVSTMPVDLDARIRDKENPSFSQIIRLPQINSETRLYDQSLQVITTSKLNKSVYLLKEFLQQFKSDFALVQDAQENIGMSLRSFGEDLSVLLRMCRMAT